VYGFDLLAWALHRTGEPARAGKAMQRALALGTRDPLLHFHAGMIARAAGRDAQAAASLRRALAINPSFDPLLIDAARTTLDSIGGR
jgi:Tfp pilus assembly protein PilF